MLNENQINQVITLLKEENQITDAMVLEEMIDHFCCSIEKKMILGISFEQAISETSKEISPDETQTIETHIEKVNFRIRLKRKVKSISAVAATLVLLMVIGADAQIKPDIPPVKGEFNITSKYGTKRDISDQKMKLHKGIDIRAKIGTPIYATANGKVNEVNFSNKGYGNKIVISHDEIYETLYAHLSSITVKANDLVKKGDLIGYSGNTGLSTGPHLHYEVLKNGTCVNPEIFIETSDE